jgi:hypothetical protein
MFNIALIISLFPIFIGLFYYGYNLLTNTQRTIDKFNSLAKVKEGSFAHKWKLFFGKDAQNPIWSKIGGCYIMLFSVVMFIVGIFSLMRECCGIK